MTIQNPTTETSVVLIGGASHTGKSTLAAELGHATGWKVLSTDSLGRHPGRPWRYAGQQVPEHVRTYYLDLTPAEIFDSVIRYYNEMWQTVQRIIERRLHGNSVKPLIVEGSALLPERTISIELPGVVSCMMTGETSDLRDRVFTSSNYAKRSSHEKSLIKRFAKRNARFNEHVITNSEAFGVRTINVSDENRTGKLSDAVLAAMGNGKRNWSESAR